MTEPRAWSLAIQSYRGIVPGARHHTGQLVDDETHKSEDVRHDWTDEQTDAWAEAYHRALRTDEPAPGGPYDFEDYDELLDRAIAQWLAREGLADGAGSVLYRGNRIFHHEDHVLVRVHPDGSRTCYPDHRGGQSTGKLARPGNYPRAGRGGD